MSDKRYWCNGCQRGNYDDGGGKCVMCGTILKDVGLKPEQTKQVMSGGYTKDLSYETNATYIKGEESKPVTVSPVKESKPVKKKRKPMSEETKAKIRAAKAKKKNEGTN